MVVTNQNDAVQPQIAHQTEVNRHVPVVIHLDAVDDAAELGVRHPAHVRDALNRFEGLVQDALELLALREIVGHDLELVLQPVDLLAHARRLFIQLLARDQVVRVHVQILLAASFQLRELLRQLLLVVRVLVLCLVDALELAHHVADHVLFRLHDLGEVCLQDGDQLVLVHRDRVGAGVRAAAVAAGADPADVGVFVGADGAAERPAAVLAFDQRRKQVLVAVAGAAVFEGV